MIICPSSSQETNKIRITHFEGHRVDEDGDEPVESNRRYVDADHAQMVVQLGRLAFEQLFEELLVSLGADQTAVEVVRRKVALSDGDEQPEAVLGL